MRTVMVAAFSGWNDAGDAASASIDHLWTRWGAEVIATLDPDPFVDFTANRPRVSVVDGVVHSLDWPATEFGWCSPAGSLGVVLVRGPEPQFRWRSYTAAVLGVADELGCSTVVTLGAMLSDVPHTRPTPMVANGRAAGALRSGSVSGSHYEGPTGIPGVLHHEADLRGFDAVSLWAAVPAYAAGVDSPKAALALVEHACTVVGAAVSIDGLDADSDDYVERLDALCEDDDDTAAYVRSLEESYDAEQESSVSADALVAELEDFLRDHRRDT
jgi:proteasome assembly chaperone (PAC2) family protein